MTTSLCGLMPGTLANASEAPKRLSPLGTLALPSWPRGILHHIYSAHIREQFIIGISSSIINGIEEVSSSSSTAIVDYVLSISVMARKLEFLNVQIEYQRNNFSLVTCGKRQDFHQCRCVMLGFTFTQGGLTHFTHHSSHRISLHGFYQSLGSGEGTSVRSSFE